jgi:hypothetical protein
VAQRLPQSPRDDTGAAQSQCGTSRAPRRNESHGLETSWSTSRAAPHGGRSAEIRADSSAARGVTVLLERRSAWRQNTCAHHLFGRCSRSPFMRYSVRSRDGLELSQQELTIIAGKFKYKNADFLLSNPCTSSGRTCALGPTEPPDASPCGAVDARLGPTGPRVPRVRDHRMTRAQASLPLSARGGVPRAGVTAPRDARTGRGLALSGDRITPVGPAANELPTEVVLAAAGRCGGVTSAVRRRSRIRRCPTAKQITQSQPLS